MTVIGWWSMRHLEKRRGIFDSAIESWDIFFFVIDRNNNRNHDLNQKRVITRRPGIRDG
jgi:hypothetical protein